MPTPPSSREPNRAAPSVPTRRTLLKAAALSLAAPLGMRGLPARAQAATPAKLTKLAIAWSATAVCTVPVPVALKQGIFEKNGLDVSFVNFAGSTDQLLESIAARRADAGVGMALRWLKPLEQGFDVKIVSGLHSGCIRLLSRPPRAAEGQDHRRQRHGQPVEELFLDPAR